MPTLIQRIMSPKPGTASPIAGLFLWQLDYGQINLLRHQHGVRGATRL